jgi:tol-pal system protein YbgF
MMQKLSVCKRFIAFATWSLFIAGTIWSCPILAQGMPDNQLMFELLNRIEQLEREMRQLRGDLEMYRYSQENANRRLQALEKQIEGNVSTPSPTPNRSESGFTRALRGSADTSPGASEQSSSTTDQSTALNKPPGFGSSSATEQAVYDAAIDRLREGNYQSAIEGFQQFLREYPTSALAGNAQYWLGEAYYVNRDFAKSRQAFIAMGTNYPDSSRLPDAMLKLGYVYEALDEKDKARQVLQKLVQTYPRTQAANLAQNRLQSLR